MKIDVPRLADSVARQLTAEYGFAVERSPINTRHDRNGEDISFDLAIEQDLGIFSMINESAVITVSAGVVMTKENTEQISAMVSLNYTHHSGGRNGQNVIIYWFDDQVNLVHSRKA